MNRREIEGTKATKCHTFVLPMCNIHPKILPTNIINVYIHENNTIVIIFDKPLEGDEYFKQFLNRMENNDNYILYEEDNNEVILHFKIPSEQLDNYNKFLAGNYSGFSEDYKERLLNIYGRKSYTANYRVNMVDTLYPQDSKRKQVADRLGVDISLIKEVIDKPDIEQETYKQLYKIQKQLNTINNINNI